MLLAIIKFVLFIGVSAQLNDTSNDISNNNVTSNSVTGSNNIVDINDSGSNNNTNINSNVAYFDTFTGRFITLETYREHLRNNRTFWCTGEFLRDCDPNEGRRVDGTCNNLKYPTRGASHTPVTRLLPPEYDRAPEFDPRRAKDGHELPLARRARTTLIQEGKVPDQHFTQLLGYALVSLTADVIAIFDTVNYVLWKPYCCAPRGRTDRECVPNAIPEDDPVHQFSGIRCQNMTRPRSFQSSGCISNDTAPVRLVSSTPAFDLSHIYGNKLANLNRKGRLFENGFLKFEVENGKIWPPSSRTASVCYSNQAPRETRCHDGPEDGGNGILGSNLFLIWLWRHHNVIARQLQQVNPCWNDEKLFQTSRDINIAYMMQIYYYEMMAALMGYDNLVHDRVLSETGGFRDFYDQELYPQISLEYPFAFRWTHLLQEGKVKMYDADGFHLKDIRMVNLTLRTGYLVDNLEFITQGAFRQAGGKIDDHIIDPDIGELALGPHQRALDVTTNDMAKNRYFGFAPYVKYKELCFGKRYRTFEDLLDTIDPERVELLLDVYKHVEDIDLIAGMWLERPVYGGAVPPTFYCLVTDQLRRTIVSDRHWYERPNRPNAFTIQQLLEVRKATIARLMCDVGDTVTQIQPQAFFRAGPNNKMCSCEQIPKMDYNAWKDFTCDSNKQQDLISPQVVV